MQCEENLRKHIQTIDAYQKMSLEDFKHLKMLDKKTQKIMNLFEYKDIDVECNWKNPLYAPASDDYVSREEGNIIFSNLIFSNTEKIQFNKSNERNFYFKNCIFLSYFIFDGIPNSIIFDNCCFKTISILPDYQSIEINSSLANTIRIQTGYYPNNVTLNNTEIGDLYISEANAANFLCIFNTIHKIGLENVINFHNFHYEQLAFLNTDKGLNTIPIRKIMDSIDSRSPEIMMSTLNFIRNLDIVTENPQFCNNIDYIKNAKVKLKKNKKEWVQNIIMTLFGYFMKPWWMLGEAFFTILLFAFVFMFTVNSSSFIVRSFESLEKSITFFFSLGSPCGMTVGYRMLGYFESLLGFLDFTVFTISLGKKYLK